MHKLIVLCALIAGCAIVVPAASAEPAVPICLISNGGSGGTFTKSLLCVELLDRDHGHAGSGRYAPGDTTTVHWLTESVEFRPLFATGWVPLATATRRGAGDLAVVTRTVRLPAPGTVRACSRVGTGTNTQVGELCSNPA